jgi:hypothetical protein
VSVIGQLLQKDVAQRPASAAEVVAALDPSRAPGRSTAPHRSSSSGSGSQVSAPSGPMVMVLAMPQVAGLGRITIDGDVPTIVDDEVPLPEGLAEAISAQAGELNRTADGTLLCTLPWPRKTRDLPRQVERAAHCALALQRSYADVRVALVVSTVSGAADLPPAAASGVADLIQRAGKLLLQAELQESAEAARASGAAHGRPVRLDRAARALLGSGFRITEEPSGVALWEAVPPG